MGYARAISMPLEEMVVSLKYLPHAKMPEGVVQSTQRMRLVPGRNEFRAPPTIAPPTI
jgi:hypothetical protein